VTTATVHPVIIYGRVSQARAEQNKSVDDQLAELHRWAEREGWPVVGAYRDDGVSASQYANGKARPGWEQAMAAVTSGTVRALLVWELSRATRDRAVSVALEAACAARGVRIGYHGRLHDPATADGAFSVGLDSLLAAKESAMTSERVRRSVESRAAAGRPHGSLPYGYRRVLDPVTGRAISREIDPEQGPVVQEIVRRLLAREPADAIATDLNRRGIQTSTGKRWRGGNLAKLALRPTYAGLRTHHGEVLDGVAATWPPIITPAEHHQLVAMFADPERDKFRNATYVRYLGSGIFHCGREGCDGRMRVVAQVDRPSRYDCRECHRVSRYREPVDLLVEETVIERLSWPDALAVLTSIEEPDTQNAAAEAAKLSAQIAEARELVTTGGISLADFATFRAKWEPQLADAERRARPHSLPGALVDMAGPDARKRWEDALLTDRRTVVDALFRVTILPIGRGGQPFDPLSVRIDPA